MTQLDGHGVIEQVHAAQFQFGEDTDGDGIINRWVTAGGWRDESRVLATRVALLQSTDGPVSTSPPSRFQVLEQTVRGRVDRQLFRVFEAVILLKGRLP